MAKTGMYLVWLHREVIIARCTFNLYDDDPSIQLVSEQKAKETVNCTICHIASKRFVS